MVRINQRRRTSTGNKLKAKPIEAMYAALFSIASIIALGVVITLSVMAGGDNSRWFGGAGILAFFVAVLAFIFNVGQMKKATDLRARITCMVISTLAFVLWAAVFIIGILM